MLSISHTALNWHIILLWAYGKAENESGMETGNGNRNWECTGAGYCTKLIVVGQAAYCTCAR